MLRRIDAVLMLAAVFVLGGCTSVIHFSGVAKPHTDGDRFTFLEVGELAERYKPRMLVISSVCSGVSTTGFGVVLSPHLGDGVPENTFVAATANHVISECENSAIRIRFCDGIERNVSVLRRQVYDERDLALLYFSLRTDLVLDSRFYAQPELSRDVFHMGVESGCDYQRLGEVASLDADGLVQTKGGSTEEGTSGGLVFGGYGAEGVLLSSGSGGTGRAYYYSFAAMKDLFSTSEDGVSIRLDASQNLPPLSEAGVQQKVLGDFDRYDYFAEEFSDFVGAGTVSPYNLNQVVPSYGYHYEVINLNKEQYRLAISSFYPLLATEFDELLVLFERLHDSIYGGNDEFRAIYEGKTNTLSDDRVNLISTNFRTYHLSWQRFSEKLKRREPL